MSKWSAASKKRALMQRRGFANSHQVTPFMAPLMQSPKPVTNGPSKAEQHAQAAEAFEQWLQKQKGA
jgi:hypothetical protein